MASLHRTVLNVVYILSIALKDENIALILYVDTELIGEL